MVKLTLKYCLAWLILQMLVYGQEPQVKQDNAVKYITPLSELQKDLGQLVSNPDFFNAHIGVSIVSVENGASIYHFNDTKNFIPASTQKVLTSAAAINYLGSDFRFTTGLYLNGELQDNGEFIGNVIIRGSGDPSISTLFYEDPLDIFEHWASVLDSIGIRSIRGNIIGDGSYFDADYYAQGWAWDDLTFPYSAQVNGLNIFGNKIDIIVEPNDSVGGSPQIRLVPENNYVGIINNIKTISDNRSNEIFHKRDLESNIIELFGNIKVSPKKKETTTISVAIDDPSLFFLNLFKLVLERNHIRFRGALLDVNDWTQKINYSTLKPIAEHISPQLSDIVKVLNQTSDNLIAECLLKTIGKEQMGSGSFTAGTEQLAKFCIKAGVPPEKIYIADGSGLSRNNLMSPRYQTQLLSYIFKTPFKKDFIESLAVPGKSGTLKNRMTSSLAEKSVQAKTGSMSGVSTICGYVTTKDNETFAFSIMVMNYTVASSVVHNLQDLICMRLASFSRKRK